MQKDKNKKVRVWVLVCLAVGAIVLSLYLLLLHRPRYFKPPEVIYDGQVSTYLTHELLPEVYNGVQRGEAFDLVVTQAGINDIVVRSRWPREFGGVRFSAPVVYFVPEYIVVVGAVEAGAAEVVATVEVRPVIDDEGLLRLRMERVKVGAVNVTPVAGMMVRRMFEGRSAGGGLEGGIVGLLVKNEGFEPVFMVEGNKVRVEKITVSGGKMVVRLVGI